MIEREKALAELMAALGRCELFGIKVWLSPFFGGDREVSMAAVIMEGVAVEGGRLVAMKTSMADDKKARCKDGNANSDGFEVERGGGEEENEPNLRPNPRPLP